MRPRVVREPPLQIDLQFNTKWKWIAPYFGTENGRFEKVQTAASKCKISRSKKVSAAIINGGKMKQKDVVYLLFSIAIVIITIKWSSETVPSTARLPIKTSNYTVVNQPSNFRVLWMKPDAVASYFYNYNEVAIMLAATNDMIIFLGGFPQTEPSSLFGINAETGSIEWTKMEEYKASTGFKLAVFANDHLFYVVFSSIWRAPINTTGASKIRAYRSDSGDSVWTRPISRATSIDSLMITELTIGIDADNSKNYYVLDAQTGQTLETRSKKENDFLWFSKDGILYESARLHAFQAIDSETGEILWQSSLAMSFEYPPILNDRVLLLRSGNSTSAGAVYALDIQTGEILWQYAGVVSNVTAQNAVAYFLTLDAHLVAVNIRTGEIIDTVEFSSSNFVLRDANGFRHGFSVAVVDDVVSVHLGDSQQIFAFRFVPNDD